MTYRILRANRVVYLLKPGRLQMHCTLCDIHVRDISCVCHLCGACELICLEDIMSLIYRVHYRMPFPLFYICVKIAKRYS